MICVCGRKRLWLYPPGDARFVYPISKERSSDAPRENRDGRESHRWREMLEVPTGLLGRDGMVSDRMSSSAALPG